jgi:hypothetical protein
MSSLAERARRDGKYRYHHSRRISYSIFRFQIFFHGKFRLSLFCEWSHRDDVSLVLLAYTALSGMQFSAIGENHICTDPDGLPFLARIEDKSNFVSVFQ